MRLTLRPDAGLPRAWFRLPLTSPRSLRWPQPRSGSPRPRLRRPHSRWPHWRWPHWPRPGWRRPRLIRPAAIAAGLAWLLAGIALFACYLHASRTVPVNSDGAANALQAWSMLHGNPLLRGWQLSDVSFYTTELPPYLLLELARGLTADVVHIAAAVTYTLVVLFAAALARGRASGPEAATRMLVTAGIMLAPQPGNASYVLLLSPDHFGSVLPVLVTWLLLDRGGRHWYVPPAAAVLLAWGLVADSIVLLTAVLPLAVVGLARAYQRTVRRRRPLRSAWFELELVAAALLAGFGARAVLSAIHSAGGFVVWPVVNNLAAFTELPHNLMLALEGLLLLFGADFTGQALGLASGLALLHLVGLGLALWAVAAGLRRLPGQDLIAALLIVGTVVSVAAYLFGTRAIDLHSTREMVAVLPFTAVLAGRVLAGRLGRARLLPALGVALIGYAVSLGIVVRQPPVPASNQQLADWLAAHQLDSGLAGYWVADSVTLDSGGRVALRSVLPYDGAISPNDWETRPSWYSPAAHSANFVVMTPAAAGLPPYPWSGNVRAAFGQPARIYYLGRYTVLVWTKNLLTELGPEPNPPGSPASHVSARTPAGNLPVG
jgi:hypothetical protein